MAMALKLLLLPQLYLSTRRSTSQSKLLSSYDFLQHYRPSTAGIDIRHKCNPIYVDIFGGPNRRAGLGLKQPYLSLRRSISRSISSAECNPNFGNSSGGVKRRSGLCLVVLMASLASLFPANEASGIDFNLIASDQTAEEAESKIRGHAEALLEVKYLIESESWKEAQRALRSSASYLKQDIRTIIMFKPANERPPLRKLYAVLFNNVTTLDYAAREKDAERVWECYENIVAALTDILSRKTQLRFWFNSQQI